MKDKKIRYPKCPYCNEEYEENEPLLDLITTGWANFIMVKCPECKKKYDISVKLMCYGRKIKDERL